MKRRVFLEKGAVATAGMFAAGASVLVPAQDTRLVSIGGTVSTRHGRVRGLLKDGVHQFWNVPYGAPTGGANRFMPPQQPAPWTGVRDHFQIRYSAVSAPANAREKSPVVEALNRRTEQSEDCLTVNVFTPGLDNKARPVMVWLHGGGFSRGDGNFLLYDGTNLAKKEDVVVVAVNHRLNIFGYLHLADIGGEKWARSSNVGDQDMVATLAWVRDNIEHFGGDPGRVTIFGVSGGGGKTMTLMGMPSAEGLFHRAIVQSGTIFKGTPGPVASEAAENFLRHLGLSNNQLDTLHRLSTEQIQAAYLSMPQVQAVDLSERFRPGLGDGPVVDGHVLPRDMWHPTAPPYSAEVPLMMGSLETENGWIGPPPYHLSDEDTLERFTAELANGDVAEGRNLLELYRRLHPEKRNQMLWLTAESDNGRRSNAQRLGRLKYAQGSAPSYLYFFDWHSPVHDERMGAFHMLDLPFIFYNLDSGASMTGSSQSRYQLAHVMSAAWAAFARNGNPDHDDMPHWPAFNPEDYPTMIFGEEVRMVNDPNQETRLKFAKLRGAES